MRVTTADPEAVGGGGIGGALGSGGAKGRVLTTAAALARKSTAVLQEAPDQVRAQAQRWFLWTPVAFGGGAAVYIGLLNEPPIWAAGLAAGIALLVAFAVRLWGRSRVLMIAAGLLAFAASGFATGVVKAWWVASPVAPADRSPVTVEGWVVDVVNADASKPRLLIAPTFISTLSPEQTPARIRVSLRSPQALIGPGQPIRLRAILGPPPPPAAPGAYDFARDAFFGGIGGSGLAIGAPQVIDLPEPSLDLRVQLAVNAGRWSLARRLVARIGEHDGGLAAALTTGHQAWLDPNDVQAMRDSGLAHILSISGVHMAIVGGFVFGGLRLLIAAWPWMALRVSGKKIAAAGGMIAIAAYLVLSGAPPPAIRSALTACIAFMAVLLDRRALSLHSLAIAALVVLAVQPEAVAQPGFQMSFAATAALLALAEAWPHPSTPVDLPGWIRWLQGLRTWLIAGAMVSLVAGMATDPFSIQHFNRVTLWGLPANISSEVLSSFVVMPMLALGVLGELVGIGEPFLWAAAWGLKGVAWTARLFAAAPHAVVWIPSAPGAALAVSFLGLLFICLWKGRLRWLGLPLFAAVWLWPRAPAPDLWIAPGGANIAVKDGASSVLLRPRAQLFGYGIWARRRGLAMPADLGAASDAAFDCGRDSCTPKAAATIHVAGWWRRKPIDDEALAALCASSDIVVLRTGEGACRGKLVIGEADLVRGGAAEAWRTAPGRWRIAWSEPLRGHRPWTAPETPVEQTAAEP